MIRYVMSVLLAVALIGASIGAADRAADIHGENKVRQTIADIESAAMSLMTEETLPPRDVKNPERQLTLSFPEDTLTSTRMESATIDRQCGGVSVVNYEMAGQVPKTISIDAPIQSIKGGPVPLGGERTRATLKLGRDQYNNKVVYFIWQNSLRLEDGDYESSGLHYEYYEDTGFPQLTRENKVDDRTVRNFSPPPDHREVDFGGRYTGEIEIPQTGIYTFYLTADDIANLWIDGTHVGSVIQGSDQVSLPLAEGDHDIRLERRSGRNPNYLTIEYEGPGIERQEIPRSALSHDPFSTIENDNGNGLHYEYYEATQMDLDEFTPTNQVEEGTIGHFYLPPDHRRENFGVRYTGYIDVPRDGTYTFYLTSDDGSILYINGNQEINNDGIHSAETQEGAVELQKGMNEIRVDYFNQPTRSNLSIKYEGPCIEKQEIPMSVLTPNPDWTNPGPTPTDTSTPAPTPTPTPPPPPTPVPPEPGLHYEYYEIEESLYTSYTAMNPSNKVGEGTVDGFNLPPDHRPEYYAVRYTGNIKLPADGTYTFYLTADDDARMYIDGTEVVEVALFGQTRQGTIELDEGTHEIRLDYIQLPGAQQLSLEVEGPNIAGKIPIPTEALTHDE